MYVHIGQDYMIPARSIVAVFDMDTATWSKHTRALIARLTHEGRVVSACEDLPKSAVCATAHLARSSIFPSCPAPSWPGAPKKDWPACKMAWHDSVSIIPEEEL